jgi:transcriptional regulator with XRE-family HTH domain
MIRENSWKDTSCGLKSNPLSTKFPGMDWRTKLKKALDDRDWSQYRLAKETGLRQSRISLWLNGQGEPGLEEWRLMGVALDIPITWFLADSDEPAPDYRTPEEQMLIRVARKVGIEAIWELIASAAVAGSGTARFVREVDEGTGPGSSAPRPANGKGKEKGDP